MNTALLIPHIVLALLALVLIYASAAPLVISDAWWIRVLDFPRLQIALLLFTTMLGYGLLYCIARLFVWEYPLIGLLGLGLVWQLYCIAPYTVLYPKEMQDSRNDNEANCISILIYNVLHDMSECAESDSASPGETSPCPIFEPLFPPCLRESVRGRIAAVRALRLPWRRLCLIGRTQPYQ